MPSEPTGAIVPGGQAVHTGERRPAESRYVLAGHRQLETDCAFMVSVVAPGGQATQPLLP